MAEIIYDLCARISWAGAWSGDQRPPHKYLVMRYCEYCQDGLRLPAGWWLVPSLSISDLTLESVSESQNPEPRAEINVQM